MLLANVVILTSSFKVMELEIFSHFCGRQKRALLEEEAGLDLYVEEDPKYAVD